MSKTLCPKVFTQQDIVINSIDGDVNITLPNGKIITLQFRGENETLDLFLPEPQIAYVHPDDDLGDPVKKSGGLVAKQIVIT